MVRSLLRGSFALVLALGLAQTAVAEEDLSASEPGRGLYLQPAIGIDVSSYSGTNVSGGVGFNGELLGSYFFSKSVGVFTGLGYVSRKMTLNSSASTGYLDIPVGFAFRYSFIPDLQNQIGLGVFFGLPLGDFADSGGTLGLSTLVGLTINMATYFPVTEGFELGIASAIRFSFGGPFEALTGGNLVGIQFGLGGRIAL